MKVDYFADLLPVPGIPTTSPPNRGRRKPCNDGHVPSVPTAPGDLNDEPQQWDADACEYVEERVAIAEYDGGLSREEAEGSAARSRVVVEYRRMGDTCWLTVLGAPGQSYDDLAESLRRRFGDVDEVRPYRPRAA